tara:strand:+ start:2925 stop:3125 length:201 start_codon:yes stop_codon:yes gene_type:complete
MLINRQKDRIETTLASCQQGGFDAGHGENVSRIGAQRSSHGDTLLNMGPVVDKEDVRRLAPPWDRC